jgi:filamin
MLSQPRLSEAIWLATYTPQSTSLGALRLVVKWSGQTISGCPLSVAIGSAVDASKVLCSGEGLRNGIVGREIKSWIDTRRAGPGELTAHCTGPRKVAYCESKFKMYLNLNLNLKSKKINILQKSSYFYLR